MKFSIKYYSRRVFKDILTLPDEMVGKFYALQDQMKEIGPNLGMPHTRAMGEGLFEIRIKDVSGIARVFYCTAEKNEIWILHSFIKKTEQTPNYELKIARRRLKEVKDYE